MAPVVPSVPGRRRYNRALILVIPIHNSIKPEKKNSINEIIHNNQGQLEIARINW